MASAVVVGSGPNGLSAAIAMASAGVKTTLLEREATFGGSVRSDQRTLPGFLHDGGAAVFPLGIGSPFFRTLPLAQHGLSWIDPSAPLAHPLDGEAAVMLERSIEKTAANLEEDGDAWMRLFLPLAKDWENLASEVLQPVLHLPRHPLLLARFGAVAMLPATIAAKLLFRGRRARALFAGLAAHSGVPLTSPLSSAAALLLGTAAHAVGWPIARGGSQSLTNALLSIFRDRGGEAIAQSSVTSIEALSGYDACLLDLRPKHALDMSDRWPAAYRSKISRFKPGCGVFKIDWALRQPIPWIDIACSRAGTLHLGGTIEEIASYEREMMGEAPYVLLSQPSLFDPTRAPSGMHTAWAYCHVPFASSFDATEIIERQVERFAPGFRNHILARSTRNTTQMEQWNHNLAGGDISGGAITIGQTFLRPTIGEYQTPLPGIFLCSSSTPPGGGAHGMSGANAAAAALRYLHQR